MDQSPPGSVLTTRWGAATDQGPVRTSNEDLWLAEAPLFAVADGMGGHASGDVAAHAALATLARALAPQALGGRAPDLGDLDAGIAAAARAVSALGSGPGGEGAPGTTLTGVLATSHEGRPHWVAFNVGDSRTCLVAGGTLVHLTRDHTARAEALRAGVSGSWGGAPLPSANIVTRALGAGMPGLPEVDYVALPAAPGDRIVVCTDGVHTVVGDDEVADVATTEPDPQRAARTLVDLALARGTRDNATAMVVHVVDLAPTWPADTPVDAASRPLRRVRPAAAPDRSPRTSPAVPPPPPPAAP